MQKTDHYHTAIIGAGPAGLFAFTKIISGSTILLEKRNLPGRKLMISGSGQCNYTHAGSMHDFQNHYGENARFLKTAFQHFTNTDAINFFKENKVTSIVDQNGKVFPASMKAGDILDVLLKGSNRNEKKLLTEGQVIKVEKRGNTFIIETESSLFTSDILILATGGKSYPSTGSTGDGYEFAASLGHTIVNPNPALAPIIIKDYPFVSLAGISFSDAEFSQWRGNAKVRTFHGDILFTHTGLSGPGILNNSRYFRSGDTLTVNFCNQDERSFEEKFIHQANKAGKSTIGSFLKSTDIPKNLVISILQQTDQDSVKPMAEISKNFRKKITTLCCAYPFIIQTVGGFKISMATAGGVSLKEINPNTMESLLVPKLYFCGEVMDIDGDTGGYNIQAALSTAYLAAADINKKKPTLTTVAL